MRRDFIKAVFLSEIMDECIDCGRNINPLRLLSSPRCEECSKRYEKKLGGKEEKERKRNKAIEKLDKYLRKNTLFPKKQQKLECDGFIFSLKHSGRWSYRVRYKEDVEERYKIKIEKFLAKVIENNYNIKDTLKKISKEISLREKKRKEKELEPIFQTGNSDRHRISEKIDNKDIERNFKNLEKGKPLDKPLALFNGKLKDKLGIDENKDFCVICAKEFEIEYPNQKTCSKKCREKLKNN